jgi:hypothetical protein
LARKARFGDFIFCGLSPLFPARRLLAYKHKVLSQ